MTTKIVPLTDALGNFVRFVLLAGHRIDTIGVPPLIEGIDFPALIADIAFDSNSIIAGLDERGANVITVQHPCRAIPRAIPRAIDAAIYRWRHVTENSFCELMEFKRIALRSETTDQSFSAMIILAAAVIHCRQIATGPKRFRCFCCGAGSAARALRFRQTPPPFDPENSIL